MKRKLLNMALISACVASVGAMSMEAQRPYEVVCRGTAAETGNARINIYDRIGNSLWEEGITAQQFVQDLAAIDDKVELDVHISSDGGNTKDGTVMYNELMKREGVTNTYVDGYAISMASVLAMVGKNSGGKTYMAKNGLMMIHKPLTSARGNANDLRAMADMLDKAEAALSEPYIEATGLEKEAIAEMLANTRWMTAEEALKDGFISEIIDNGDTVENCLDVGWLDQVDEAHKEVAMAFYGAGPEGSTSGAPEKGAEGAQASGADDDAGTEGAQASGADDDAGTEVVNVAEVQAAERKRMTDIMEMCNSQGFPEKAMWFVENNYSLEMAQEFITELKAAVDERIDGNTGGGNPSEPVKSGDWAQAYASV